MPRAFSMSNVAAAAESCLRSFQNAHVSDCRDPCDGIGKEVIPAGVEVLQALAERDSEFLVHRRNPAVGSDYYRETGRFMPEDGVATPTRLRRGSTSAPSATRTLPII